MFGTCTRVASESLVGEDVGRGLRLFIHVLDNEASVFLRRHFQAGPTEPSVTIGQVIGAWLFHDAVAAYDAAASTTLADHISCTQTNLAARDPTSVYSVRAKGGPGRYRFPETISQT